MSLFRKFNSLSKSVSHNGNFCHVILEEVALEGLDGITFEDLVIRLGQVKDFFLTFDGDSSKEFLFQAVRGLLSSVPKNEYDQNSETLRGLKYL